MAHLREEGEPALRRRSIFPETRTRFRDRHVLIVVRGTDHVRDLRALRAYIDDVNPILVGVDGGADAIIGEGLVPDVILGDMDSAGEAALRERRRADRPRLSRRGGAGRRAPPPARARAHRRPLGGDEPGRRDAARLREGRRADRQRRGALQPASSSSSARRGGMSSTFLTRLRIGEKLVDARGVSHLYPAR